MVYQIPFVLDPTEEDIVKLGELGMEYFIIKSDEPKDISLVSRCKELNCQVLLFIFDKWNNEFGKAFGFGESEDDFMQPFIDVNQFVKIQKIIQERIK